MAGNNRPERATVRDTGLKIFCQFFFLKKETRGNEKLPGQDMVNCTTKERM